MREREKKSSKGERDFFFQFTYDPFVAGTMGQPSHLERVIFWTKVTFHIFEMFQPKTSQTQMFRAIDFLRQVTKRAIFTSLQQFGIYPLVRVLIFESSDIPLNSTTYRAEITSISKKYKRSIFAECRVEINTCRVEIFLNSLSR